MSRIAGWVVGAALALYVAVCACRAQTPELTQQQRRDLIVEATQTYDRGIAQKGTNPASARAEFLAAAQKLELVIASGVRNAPIHYNLANAYMQSGDIGRAVLNYRRAWAFAPGDADVRSNLESARSQCKTPITPGGRQALVAALLWWHTNVPLRTRSLYFLIAHVIVWTALLLNVIRPWGTWRVMAMITAIAWIPLGVSVGTEFLGWGRDASGVLLTDNVIVRKGNGTGFEPQFAQPLAAGVEFTVTERRGEWLHIMLPNGADGWIEAAQAETDERRPDE